MKSNTLYKQCGQNGAVFSSIDTFVSVKSLDDMKCLESEYHLIRTALETVDLSLHNTQVS